MVTSNQEFAKIYDSLSHLSSIPDQSWKDFEPHLEIQELEKGAFFLQKGDRPVRVAFVLSGLLRSYYLTPEGEEYVKNFSKPGEFFSDYKSAILNEPSELFIDALEPTRLVSFSYDPLAELFDADPAWQRIGRKIAERYYLVREKHARDLLMLNGSQRYEAFKERFPYLVGQVPQRYIAQYLGISEVSLSRLRAKGHKNSK